MQPKAKKIRLKPWSRWDSGADTRSCRCFMRTTEHSTSKSRNQDQNQKKNSKKEEPEKTAGDENPQKDKTPDRLPMPLDVRQYLIDGLEDIDARIREVQEIIDARIQERTRLEALYKHIVDCIGR